MTWSKLLFNFVNIPSKFRKYLNELVTVCWNHIWEATEKLMLFTMRYAILQTWHRVQDNEGGKAGRERNRTIARIAGLTGHNIAITSITATRRIAVGWIPPERSPKRNQPQPPLPVPSIYISEWHKRRGRIGCRIWKGLPLNKCFLINHWRAKPPSKICPSALCRHPSSVSSATRRSRPSRDF